MERIADAAVALRIATRKACMGNEQGKKKNTLSLETKILFLIKDKPLTPNNLIDALALQKSNLASLARQMEESGLIVRKKLPGRRETAYHITESGAAYLDGKLNVIDESFKKFLSDEKDYESAIETLNAAVRLLSFIE